MAACVLTAWHAGRDYNYDLRNYHVYSAWALLHGRVFDEVLTFQQYLNPLIQLPAYLLLGLPARLASAILASVHAIGPLLVGAILLRLMPGRGWTAGFLATAAVAMAVTGPFFQGGLGTSLNENLLAIPLLGGVLILAGVLDPARAADRDRDLFAAALLFGLAAGLKLTTAPFALAATVALVPALLLACGWRCLSRSLGLWSAGGVVGGLPGLWWASVLYGRFGNPTFPFFNQVWRSSAAPFESFSDARFGGSGIADLWLYPWSWAVHGSAGSEVEFQDPRFILALPLALAGIGLALRLARRDRGRAALLLFVCLFLLGGFALWLHVFGIRRYLVPLELLAGVVIIATIALTVPSERVRLALVAAVALAVALGTIPLHFERRAWTPGWIEFQPGAVSLPPDAFVIATDGALGYLRPALPDTVRMTALRHDYMAFGPVLDGVARAQAHAGPVYWVRESLDVPVQERLLREAGFEPDQTSCRLAGERLHLCRLHRAGETVPQRPFYRIGETLDFTRRGAVEAVLTDRWYRLTPTGVWTLQPVAGIVLDLEEPATVPLRLEIGMATDWRRADADAGVVVVNGEYVGQLDPRRAEPGDLYTFDIEPRFIAGQRRIVVITAPSWPDRGPRGAHGLPAGLADGVGIARITLKPAAP